MKHNRHDLLLHEPNLYKAFFILAMPIFFSNLLKSLHDIVDTYFLAKIPDSVSAQAAISVSWPLFDISMALSMGLAVAGISVISQNMGADKREDAQKYAGLLFTLTFCIGLVVNIVLYFTAPYIMEWIGASGEVLRCSIIYIRVRSFEVCFLMIFTSYQSMRQAVGDMTSPVYLSSATIILNILLTGIMVKPWGIFGAAFATLISQIAIVPFALYNAFKPNDRLFITVKDLAIDVPKMKLLFNVAVPSAMGQAISSLGFLIMNSLILDYGAVVVAAFSIGNKISNLLLMPMGAIGTVQASYMGQNIGANNKERAVDAYKTGRNLGLIISITGCLIIYPFRRQTLSALTNSPEVLEVAMEYMFWVLLLQPLMGMFQNYVGTFNGSGKTKYTMIFTLTRLWGLRLPLIWLFKNFTDLGRMGIWMAMVLSNFLILFLGHYFWKKMDFKSIINT